MPEEGRLYGRRKGRAFSAARTALMDRLWPELAIDLAVPPPSALRDLFPVPVEDIRLEIGCGSGEHLLAEALANPETGFIGVEPFQEGLGKLVAGVDRQQSQNIRLSDGDAALLLAFLPTASLSRVDLLFPDPWPKRRHWKRRFVSEANLEQIARALRPGGTFRVASDIPAYIDWTLLHILPRADLVWTARTATDWRQPWRDWPGTRYERKALAAGRPPAYLVFSRT